MVGKLTKNGEQMNSVDRIWSRLEEIKLGSCAIDAHDEFVLKQDIVRKLGEGWTSGEIVFLLSWSEYFNNVTSEEICLQAMSDVYRTVEKRLANVVKE